MNRNKFYAMQMFAAEAGTTVKADLEPAISIDITSNLAENIDELRQVLGVTDMQPMAQGTILKMYKMEQVNTPAQVGEGETIKLTEIKRVLAKQVEITLKKYRKNTTAEAIQKVGRETAINRTDEKLVSGIQKDVKKDFYESIKAGTGTATGTGLQSALAAAWGKLKAYYEDIDATPIYFVSAADVADYLGKAQVTLQTAFGMSYIEDFLGLGTVIVTPALPAGTLYATAKENIRGAYIPAGSGDLAQTFGLTADATGLVGMTHSTVTGNATIDTLVFSGVTFYPEMLDGVIKTTITGA